MSRYIVEGGFRLNGEIGIHGAKNSALPILAASLLTTISVIHNCPPLSDVQAACNILAHLGCKVTSNENCVTVHTVSANYSKIPDNLVSEMRSSVLFLGAILARFGKVTMSFPGGCELGPRPIDLHISSLRKLGATIIEDHGYLKCSIDGRFKGAEIMLPFPSVGATENILLAAATAIGTTIVHNAAQEPEIADLADYLNACGANIIIDRYNSIVIKGVDKLHECEHKVIPDRIAAATYLCCGAITGGDILIKGVCPKHILSILPYLEEMGCYLTIMEDKIRLIAPKRLKSTSTIKTMPYPGFPTDAQSPFMATTTVAKGTTVFIENIFQSRYKQVDELSKMGAKIKIESRIAIVEGVDYLHGGMVSATDLRGGAALVVAALAADGNTIIDNIRHIDRGYYNIEGNLSQIGAKILREN